MKKTDIVYNGVDNGTPEDACAKGAVSMGFGLTSVTEVSTPIVPPSEQLYHLGDDARVLLIHKGTGYENVFVYDADSGKTRAYRKDLLTDGGAEVTDGDILAEVDGEPTSMAVIGNVVVLTFADHCLYLYRNADGYIVRSNKIPPLRMKVVAAVRSAAFEWENVDGDTSSEEKNHRASFYPDGYFPSGFYKVIGGNGTGASKYNLDNITAEGATNDRSEENEAEQAHMAQFTKMIADWGKKGYLFTPVLLRACVRLKTGEAASLTNPVLCFPYEDPMIAGFCGFGNIYGGYENTPTSYRGVAYKLFGKFSFGDDGNDIEIYKDIIDSIEVYMSAPIYTFTTDGRDLRKRQEYTTELNGFGNVWNRANMHFFDAAYRDQWNNTGSTQPYKRKNMSGYASKNAAHFESLRYVISLGKKENALSYKELEKVATFYRVCSIPFEENLNRAKAEDLNDEAYRKEIYADCYFDAEEVAKEYGKATAADYAAVGGDENGKVGSTFAGYRKLLTGHDDGDMSVTTEDLASLKTLDDALRSSVQEYPTSVTAYNSRLINVGNTVDYTTMSEAGISVFDKCVPLSGIKGVAHPMRMDVNGGILTTTSSPIRGIAEGTDESSGQHFYAKVQLGANAVDFFNENEDNDVSVPYYLTCDDPNVTKVRFEAILRTTTASGGTANNASIVTLKMERHDYLSLSYYKGEYTLEDAYAYDEYGQLLGPSAAKETYDALKKRIEEDPSLCRTVRNDYIKASDTADPYTFDSANTAYFNSTVRSVKVVPEAISLGQYGQNQLYAICEDGIYSVDVNSEGKLSGVSTYSNDIISDPGKVCVVNRRMVANNGISWDMYHGQTKETLLSLARNMAFVYDTLPHLTDVPEAKEWAALLGRIAEGEGKGEGTLFHFLQNCNIAYDGRNDILIGYGGDLAFTAMYKKEFGLHMVNVPATYSVQGNATVLADSGHRIYDFSKATMAGSTSGMIVTRAFRLNDTDANGTGKVMEAIVRGLFPKGKVRMILYGTKDYIRWYPVASSANHYLTNRSGTAYRAYRLVVFAGLERDEYISHVTIGYTEDETGRSHF